MKSSTEPQYGKAVKAVEVGAGVSEPIYLVLLLGPEPLQQPGEERGGQPGEGADRPRG